MTCDMDSAAAAAAVKSAGKARPPGIAEFGATKESELAVLRRMVEQLFNTSSEFAVSRLLEELGERFAREFGHSVEFRRTEGGACFLLKEVRLIIFNELMLFVACVLTSLRSHGRTSTGDISYRDGASSLASQILVKTNRLTP